MKLVKNSIQRDYEVTFLVTGDLLDADVAKIRKEMSDTIVKLKGKVLEEIDWDRKLLAYKIHHAGKAHHEAIFTHLIVKMAPDRLKKLNKALDLHPQIMRHLIVSKEASFGNQLETEKKEKKAVKEESKK